MMTDEEEITSLRRRNEDLRASLAAQTSEIAGLKAAVRNADDILNMLGLCGEREVMELPGFATPEKLRALIDGLIAQRRRADRLERVLAFAASVIKLREPWTDACEREIGGALRDANGA